MQITSKRLAKTALAALGLAALGAGITTMPARAGVTTYIATDSGTEPGTIPTNSNAKAVQFDAAAAGLGTESLVNFESAPVGPFTSVTIAPGVTVTGLDYLGNKQAINNTPFYPPNPAVGGYNTTVGGANYLDILGGTAVFTFAAPVQAFGAYFTGVQPTYFTDTITFNDGSIQSVTIPQVDATSGGVTFAGFTDSGKSITQITITASNSAGQDAIGLDDLRFVATPPVPEASTTASFGLLLALGVGGLVFAARKRKTA